MHYHWLLEHERVPGARSSDVRLDAVASIGSDRAATAKGGDGIGAGI
jgi:hypothetical protein